MWLREPEKPAGAGLDDFVEAGFAGRPEALLWLAEELATLDVRGEVEAVRVALGRLAQRPGLALRVAVAGRSWWYRTPRKVRIRTVSGPGALVIASEHPDGRVRQRAVELLAERSGPEVAPFLVLRTADWVPQVRTVARAWLANQLHDDPLRYLPVVIGMSDQIRRWSRGTFAADQAFAAGMRVPRELWDTVAGGASPVVRRFAFDVALRAGRIPAIDLITIAETDPDPVLRDGAAEAAVRSALWTGRIQHLRRLAGSRRRGLRAVALTGLVRAGDVAEVATFLDDPAAPVRAIARDAARRTGIDALAHYRAQLAQPVPPLGAVDGLAEIGTTADGALLAGLLTHPAAKVRAHAVRGLGRRFDMAPETFVPLLRDESDAVIREATARLRPDAQRLPAELPWELLADPARPAVRRAGYRLLTRLGWSVWLRAALLLATDAEPGLAMRGRVDVAGLMTKVRYEDDPFARLDKDTGRLLRDHLDRERPK